MFKTLYAKLSIALILLLTAIGMFYTVLSLYCTSYYLQKTEQKINFNLAKNLVQDKKLVKEGEINQKALSATFMEYMVINPSIEIYLLDIEGKILSYSAEPGKVKRGFVSLEPITKFLQGETFPLLGDDPRSYDKQKIFSVTPIPSQENLEGYLYVVLLGEQYDDVEQFIQESVFWKQTGLALIGSLITGLILGLFLFKKLTYRLNKLSSNIESFRKSDFSQLSMSDASKNGKDEIQQLEHTFSQMQERILSQVVELKNQDNLRRELIANVSHDLRTPLATLHGYLETLELKPELDKQEQSQYVQLALQSSRQLNSLLTELFELSMLEATEVTLSKESFNLSELTYDVAHKFKLIASKKNIVLTLDIDNESLFCHAEIGLISRVLENLINNAIKFTPSGGKVNVTVTQNDRQITTVVSDSGIGIEKENLKKVFHRFYQATSNCNRSNPGGLGLAIAKRIIELHHGDIYVESSAYGTNFTFVLPVHE